MTEALGGQIMTEFVGLKAKTYSYLKWWRWKRKKHKKVYHKKKT